MLELVREEQGMEEAVLMVMALIVREFSPNKAKDMGASAYGMWHVVFHTCG